MHRSASTTRASDEYHMGMAATTTTTLASAGGKGGSPGGGLMESSCHHHHHHHHLQLLPKYDPQSDLSKKEAARARSTESAIHLIPLVLIACALLLWLFSSPQINMTIKADSMVAKIENLTIQGHSSDTNSSSPLEDALAANQQRRSTTTTTGDGEDNAMISMFPDKQA